MNKIIFFEGFILILFSYYVMTHEYIYDSLIGARVSIVDTKYILSIGLFVFGLLLINSSFKKSK